MRSSLRISRWISADCLPPMYSANSLVCSLAIEAKRYTDITKLTPELLRLFIQKIVVHEKSVKYSKYSEQTVEIHYTDIGFIGETGEEEKPQQEIA